MWFLTHEGIDRYNGKEFKQYKLMDGDIEVNSLLNLNLSLIHISNRSVMFGSLSGSKLGIWVAHGEGKFSLPYDEDKYNVVAKYSYDEYPANPNCSDYSGAALASACLLYTS